MNRRDLRRLTLLAWLLLLLPACGLHFGSATQWLTSDGQPVEFRNGSLYVNDVRLAFDRWILLEGDWAQGTSFTAAVGTGAITLSGGEGPAYALEAHLYSELQGDGEVTLEGGRLVARSSGGHKLAINGLRGSLPAVLGLDLSSGTGDLSLEGMSAAPEIELNSGTGRVRLTDCGPLQQLSCGLGTAGLWLERVQAVRVQVETGTGPVTLTGCEVDDLKVDSGTGELRLLECTLETLLASTGTADLLLRGCQAGRVKLASGTGNVIVDGGRVEALDLDLGTGDPLITGQAEVGTITGT